MRLHIKTSTMLSDKNQYAFETGPSQGFFILSGEFFFATLTSGLLIGDTFQLNSNLHWFKTALMPFKKKCHTWIHRSPFVKFRQLNYIFSIRVCPVLHLKRKEKYIYTFFVTLSTNYSAFIIAMPRGMERSWVLELRLALISYYHKLYSHSLSLTVALYRVIIQSETASRFNIHWGFI